MNPLISSAIVGTGQQGNAQLRTNTPVDALAEQLTDLTTERKILLTAGAWATYCRAGASAQAASAAPTPASPEALPACSSKAAQLLANLLGGDAHELLPEALTLLKQGGMRLPYTLLPTALKHGAQHKELRPLLIPVLGERGRWLSQFNKEWAWVAQFLNESVALTPEASAKIWQEGTLGQRVEVLRALRGSDPAQARDWLLNVWKQEKAEPRAALLATISTGLSPDDEAFLEKALDDRAEAVRTQAAQLLARLPASAFSQRMIARADAMLVYQDNQLQIKPPAKFEKDWQRDGIAEKPPYSRVGERGWWLQQVMKYVSPLHWETRFSLSPAQLLDAAAGNEWQQTLIEGWSEAVGELYRLTDWATPLWDWWHHKGAQHAHHSADTYLSMLVPLLPHDALEKRSLPLLPGGYESVGALSALPRPWRAEFALTCLQMTREYVQEKKNFEFHYSMYTTILPTIARSIPSECFDAVEQAWDLPDGADDWYIQNWKKEIDGMLDIIHLRKRLLEEMK